MTLPKQLKNTSEKKTPMKLPYCTLRPQEEVLCHKAAARYVTICIKSFVFVTFDLAKALTPSC